MKFEWNKNKERINIHKHGGTFEQASSVFADPFALNLNLALVLSARTQQVVVFKIQLVQFPFEENF